MTSMRAESYYDPIAKTEEEEESPLDVAHSEPLYRAIYSLAYLIV